MRRIPIPICTCCNKSRAEWESERWPTVRLCYVCSRELAQHIVEVIQVVDGNPILIELAKGVNPVTQDGRYYFWAENPDMTFRREYVRERPESRRSDENSI